MALTTTQVAQAAAAAGWPPDLIPTVAGIAWRESRNNPTAVGDVNNPKAGCRSLGLMQINVCPQYNNAGIWYREPSETDPNHPLFSPVKNMAAALDLYNREKARGRDPFRPWSTYRSGIPAPDMARIASELAAAGGIDQIIANLPPNLAEQLAGLGGAAVSAASGALGGAAGSLEGFQFFGMLLDPDTWIRVGLVVAGVVAAAGALYLIAKDQGWIPSVSLAGTVGSPTEAAEAAQNAPATAAAEGTA